jgi:hypothetical protein
MAMIVFVSHRYLIILSIHGIQSDLAFNVACRQVTWSVPIIYKVRLSVAISSDIVTRPPINHTLHHFTVYI